MDPPHPAATVAMLRAGDASQLGRSRWWSRVSQMLRWLRAGVGTKWDVGRWRGGGKGPWPAPPHLSLPEVTGNWKEHWDNCEGGGGSWCQPRCQCRLRAAGSLGVLFPLCSTQHQPRLLLLLTSEGRLSFLLHPPMPTLCCHLISHQHRVSLRARSIRWPGWLAAMWGHPTSTLACFIPCPLPRTLPGGSPVGLSQTRVAWDGAKGRLAVCLSPLFSFLTGPLGALCMPRELHGCVGCTEGTQG